MSESLRALLEGLIDYAGLFPPAALSMQDAVRNYARYRDGEYAWALGKFIVPRERAKEVPPEFPLSILGIDEIKCTTAEEIAQLPAGTYVEITDLSLIPAIAQHGLRAKFRTGGVTQDAFPTAAAIAAFLRACRKQRVAFKATAGLHHPLRCVKPLTYEPNAAVGMMHGFLNVFLAAALIDDAEAVLAEEDASAFAFDDDGVTWRDQRVETEELRAMRRDFAISFGSCSFEEPIGDLKELGWLD
ncbi:MAG TPA: hypothetical protein VFN10_02820 [Thermoanaerobaculia bacterium]|nr:hypothetical protein [Thermoanaerobaculia bacterium]